VKVFRFCRIATSMWRFRSAIALSRGVWILVRTRTAACGIWSSRRMPAEVLRPTSLEPRRMNAATPRVQRADVADNDLAVRRVERPRIHRVVRTAPKPATVPLGSVKTSCAQRAGLLLPTLPTTCVEPRRSPRGRCPSLLLGRYDRGVRGRRRRQPRVSFGSSGASGVRHRAR